jgi:mycothiol synthase
MALSLKQKTKSILKTLEEAMTQQPERFNNFIIRPPAADDIPAIVDVLNADWLDIQGRADSTIEEYTRSWAAPDANPTADMRIATTLDGTVVGVMHVTNRSPYVRSWIWGCVHPVYRGQGLGTRLTEWGTARTRERIPAAPPDARVVAGCNTPSTHRLGAELLRNLGFQPVRSFYHMKIAMDSPPPAPVWSPGITVRSMQPDQEEAVYRAMREAFRDHWGYVDAPFEEGFPLWQHFIRTYPHYEPDCFFLAMDGDEIAGIANCFPVDNEFPEMAWVDDLGVRRPWRRQGIALALLHHAFGVFYRRGIRQVGLGVDASSLTGATRLYEKAGMHVFRQFDSYEKELRPGKDLMTQSLE